jgi:hypothetical protein
MIPLIFHFAYFRRIWKDFHTVCLQTCKGRATPERIIVHYDRDGEGPDWEAARDISGIEWRKVDLPKDDHLYRRDVLDSEGGFFCDLDFIFLKSFEELRRTPALIGSHQHLKLNMSLIGSEPGSDFIRALKVAEDPIDWDISTIYRVTIPRRHAFYPVTRCNKTFWSGGGFTFEKTHAVHLWEKLHPELSVPQLMETCLGDTIQAICDPKPTVTVLAGRSISFD